LVDLRVYLPALPQPGTNPANEFMLADAGVSNCRWFPLEVITTKSKKGEGNDDYLFYAVDNINR
jgi:hypothetical protein